MDAVICICTVVIAVFTVWGAWLTYKILGIHCKQNLPRADSQERGRPENKTK